METDIAPRRERVGWLAGRVWGPVYTRTWRILAVALVVAVGVGLTLRPRLTPVAHGGPLAPDFALPLVSGRGVHPARSGMLTLRSLRGHPILLNFFLSNCGPCLDELPLLRQAPQTYRAQGLVVVGIATLGDTASAARRLAAAARLPYPVVADDQATAWQYGVAAVPTSLFVDAQGHLVGQYIGPLDRQVIRNGLAQVGAIQCADCRALEPLSIDATTTARATFNADFRFTPPRAAPFFALRDQQGRLVSPPGFHGKVVALTFISALCREQCPLIGRTLSRVRQQLGRAAQRLSIVAISVDPEIDTPAATHAFAVASGWRGADWHYLTGPRGVLAPVWAAYGMEVPRPAPIFKPGQTIVHQAGLFLLDGRGRLRAYYDTPFFAPRVAATVRALLQSS